LLNRTLLTSNIAKTLEELIEVVQENDCVFDVALPAKSILGIFPVLPNNSGLLIQKPLEESLKEVEKILDLCNKKRL